MNLLIRKATLSDAPDMANILMRSWEAAYAGIIPDEAIREKNAGRPAMWQKTLSGEHHNYIALDGDTPAGLMGLCPSRDDDLSPALRPLVGEVGAIYLHPDFWDRGYGREMMAFALDTLGRQGFSVITLWVLEENTRARRFYEKCGFYFDGTQKEIVIGKPLVEVRCRKDIAAVSQVDVKEHADTLTALIRRSFAGVAKDFGLTPENCPSNPAFTDAENLIKRLGREDCHSLALYVGEKPVGFAALMPAENGAYEITRLAVLPEHRHMGYGRMLLDACTAKAYRLGCRKLVIGIIDANTVLKDWYRSYGLVETATKEYPFLPFTVCEMAMEI